MKWQIVDYPDDFWLAAGSVRRDGFSHAPLTAINFFGGFITHWGGPGSGSKNGTFNMPQGIAVDSAGNVYVADMGNNRIQKFNSTGGFLMTWGGYGSGNGRFSNPTGVAVDSAGNVYVADSANNRIQKFDSTGTFNRTIGSVGTQDGQFRSPWSVAVDSAGNVYVVDTNNNRIQKFAPAIPPVGNFTPNMTNGTFPLTVGFIDQSTGSLTSWLWSFGDGNTSTVQNLVHIYTTPGTYSVNLTATNAGGSNTTTKTGFITVQAPVPTTVPTTVPITMPTTAIMTPTSTLNYLPVANFTVTPQGAPGWMGILVTDTSVNATSVRYDLGDGTTTTYPNFRYTYWQAGTYAITLTATSATGSSNKTITVVVPAVPATTPIVSPTVTSTEQYPPVANFTVTSGVGPGSMGI